MFVRPASQDDLAVMVDLLEAVASERTHLGTEPPIDRGERIARFAKDLREGAIVLVAEMDGRVVGHLDLHEKRGLFDLGMLVASEARGKGVGRALLDAGIERAVAAGGHKITLQVWPHNEAAIGLYESAGFEKEGYLRRHWKRSSGEIWDVVLMGLHLNGPADPAPRA